MHTQCIYAVIPAGLIETGAQNSFLRNFACKPSRKFSSGQYYVKCIIKYIKNVRGRQSKGQYIIILEMGNVAQD